MDDWTWDAPGARAVFTDRSVGNVGLHVGDDPAAVFASRERAAALLGLDASRAAGVTQVHGADVWLDMGTEGNLSGDVRWDIGPSPIEADALVTNREEVALAVGVADCLPIAVVWGDAIGAIHAGWRSLAGGVIEATMAVLRRSAGSAVGFAGTDPHAVIGPALGPCCMEVGEEVAERFDASVLIRRSGAPRPHLDARADARRRLEAAGCIVTDLEVCTRCDDRLFSHRGDLGGAATGRQAVLIRRA